MNQSLPTFAIILLLALGSWASRWLVELPHYPVGAIHGYLVFLCGALAICCVNISISRKSIGYQSLAGLFLGLCLALGLFPDLSFRWPDALLLGVALNQIILYLSPSASQTGKKTYLYCGLAAASLLAPLLTVIYMPWPTVARPYVAGASYLAIAVVTVLLRKNQPRRVAPLNILFIVGILLIGASLVCLVIFHSHNTLEVRLRLTETLFWFLMITAALFVAGMFESERALRTSTTLDLDASMRDPLTGVANRRALDTHGPQLITKSLKSGRPISIIVCDIDHFKQINDIHGHQAGDSSLRKVVEILTTHVRQSDLVTRFGGEEFVIILPGSPLAPAIRLAERIRQAIKNERMSAGNHQLRITASFGIATAFPENPVPLNELIRIADANLYTAKRDGRNCVRAGDIPEDAF